MSCPRASNRSAVGLRADGRRRRTPGCADDCGRRRDPTGPVGTCCLPSGLSPSVLEFHQVNRPLAAAGSRTVTAGSELHRPPEHVCSPVCRRPGAVSPCAGCASAHPRNAVDRAGSRCCTGPRAPPHSRDVPRPRALVAVALARAVVRAAPPSPARAGPRRARAPRPRCRARGAPAARGSCGARRPARHRRLVRSGGPPGDANAALRVGAAGRGRRRRPRRGPARRACGRRPDVAGLPVRRDARPRRARRRDAARPAPTGTRMPRGRRRWTSTGSDATTRLGRETWWAEASPREDYDPRCSRSAALRPGQRGCRGGGRREDPA